VLVKIAAICLSVGVLASAALGDRPELTLPNPALCSALPIFPTPGFPDPEGPDRWRLAPGPAPPAACEAAIEPPWKDTRLFCKTAGGIGVGGVGGDPGVTVIRIPGVVVVSVTP